jgi:hypothetical protein
MSTQRSKYLVVFNLASLYDNLRALQKVSGAKYAAIHDFLINTSVRDTRVAADEDTSSGYCLTTMRVEYQPILFDSINYSHIFVVEKPNDLLDIKIKIYNRLAARFSLATPDWSKECLVSEPTQYATKLVKYLPVFIKNCVTQHVDNGPYNSEQEGVYEFWKIVEELICQEKNKMELNDLKVFRGNA